MIPVEEKRKPTGNREISGQWLCAIEHDFVVVAGGVAI